VNGLLARGHEITVVTSSSDLAAPIWLGSGALKVFVGRRRGRHMARDRFAFERRDLGLGLQDATVDVLHAHWTYEFALAALADGRPCVVTVHDHAPTILRHRPDPFRLVRLTMYYEVLRRAPLLTANSAYLMRRLPRWARAKAKVVPDFIDPLLSSVTTSGETDGSPRLVSVANGFGRRKNVQTMLKAFASVRARRPDARLDLIGVDMSTSGPAHDYAKALGLTAGVAFRGELSYPQTLQAIADADVLVHSAFEESFGMTVLEAMALGTRVVGGGASGNVPDLLQRGQCGWLCDVRDSYSLAAAILKALDSPVADAVADRARRRAQAVYSREVALDGYLSAYAEALAKETCPGRTGRYSEVVGR
jgi:L-malate glycosyltransferase